MANNQILDPGLKLSVAVTQPTTPTSNAPVRWLTMTGVALTNKGAGGNVAANTTVDFGFGSWTLSVYDGVGGGIAIGDSVYFADTPVGSPAGNLTNVATGNYFFGIAKAVVSAGQTTSIEVLHLPFGGLLPTAAVAALAVGTSQLAANAVTAAKLTATLAKGYIPLPLGQWRTLTTNDIPNTAATPSGGILTLNTTPLLHRENVATDKQQSIQWAAAGVGEIVIGGIMSPPDLDNTAPVIFKAYARMGGATDTPTLGISMFEGIGGSNIGGNTGAVTGTTSAIYSVNCTATATAAAQKPWAFGLVPAAHGTDALNISAMWLEYTRK